MSSLRIVFAGTPEFAVPAFKKLICSRHAILGALTQPDRPAGRGKKTQASPVKLMALDQLVPIYQPKTLRADDEMQPQNWLRELQPDLLVVVAYGLILPKAVLAIPRLGCLNVHPSLLPKWRGAAPIQRSIEAGDTVSGVTIMQMEEGMDTGAILKQEKYTLKGNETSAALHATFAEMGASLLLQTIEAIHEIKPIPQDNAKATYAHKISKAEAVIDWAQPAETLVNKIRAFNPWPCAFTISPA